MPVGARVQLGDLPRLRIEAATDLGAGLGSCLLGADPMGVQVVASVRTVDGPMRGSPWVGS